MNIDGIKAAAIAVGQKQTELWNAQQEDEAEPMRLELRCVGSRLNWDNVIYAVFYESKQGNYHYFECDRHDDATIADNWKWTLQNSSFNKTEFDEIICLGVEN